MTVTISGSTGIANPLGSASAPSESNTSNSNTGAYFPTGTTYAVATAGTNALYIDASQNVGIGTTSTLNNARMTVAAGNPQIVTRHNSATAGKFWNSPYVDANNILYLINQNNVGQYMTDGATVWTANSDERLKDIISPITSALDGVKSLRAVKYSWKSDDAKTPHVGLIAQDVQKVLPEVVQSAKLPLSDDQTEYLGVAYTEVIPLLVAAINELSAEVTALKEKVGA